MSTRRGLEILTGAVLAIVGLVVVYRKATEDTGGSYDPARPR